MTNSCSEIDRWFIPEVLETMKDEAKKQGLWNLWCPLEIVLESLGGNRWKMDTAGVKIASPLRSEAISALPAPISHRFCCHFRKDFPARSPDTDPEMRYHVCVIWKPIKNDVFIAFLKSQLWWSRFDKHGIRTIVRNYRRFSIWREVMKAIMFIPWLQNCRWEGPLSWRRKCSTAMLPTSVFFFAKWSCRDHFFIS